MNITHDQSLQRGYAKNKEELLQKLEEELVRGYLEATHWNILRAAKLAKMERGNFYRLMKRLGLERSIPIQKVEGLWKE